MEYRRTAEFDAGRPWPDLGRSDRARIDLVEHGIRLDPDRSISHSSPFSCRGFETGAGGGPSRFGRGVVSITSRQICAGRLLPSTPRIGALSPLPSQTPAITSPA